VTTSERAQPARGFTLIEVMGVMLVLTILLTVAVNFYINLSRQTERASDNTREVRRAATLLDRVAHDLEQALLVTTREGEDPLANPFIFLGEPRLGGAGSDHLKFVKRETPRSSEGSASDLVLVAYTLEPNAEGGSYALHRWSRPELPPSQELEFPPDGDPDSLLVADDVAYFSARFLDEQGEWQPSWDSSQVIESSQLPFAVEIELALAEPPELGESEDDGFEDEPVHYVRVVQLPVRPIDLAVLLDPEAQQGGGEGAADGEVDESLEGKTIADCVDLSQLPADLRNTYLARAAETPYGPYAEAIQNAYPSAVLPGCRL